MKLQSGLPKQFLLEVTSTTCYLVNKSPSTKLDTKVADEVLSSKEVDYSILSIFGYPAYAHIDNTERSRLDAKSKMFIFINYPKGIMGYRLLDPEVKKVVTGRDVVFDEKTMLKSKSAQNYKSSSKESFQVQVEFDKTKFQLLSGIPHMD